MRFSSILPSILKISPKMAKRKADTLTGGTGDVNPEFVYVEHLNSSGTASNTQSNLGILLPIPQNYNRDMVNVAELLNVQLLVDNIVKLEKDCSGADNRGFCWQLSVSGPPLTSGTPAAGHLFNLPTNDVFFRQVFLSTSVPLSEASGVRTAIGPGQTGIGSVHIDLTDKAGHGKIVYGQSLVSSFIGIFSGSLSQQVTGTWCIVYRVKAVPLNEYVAGLNVVPGKAIVA